MTCKIDRKWIALEMEHTSNPAIARKIVQDHIKEFGCQYYPSLIKMEKRLKKWNPNHFSANDVRL